MMVDMYTQEEIIHDLLEAERTQSKEEGRADVAMNMLKKGFDHETVAECSMISIEKVEELARSLTA